ncbi:MAG TPA: hypothetical protein VIK89_08720 [Cytophagaceae bacterium]
MKRKEFTRNPPLSEEGRAALTKEVRERIKKVQKEDIEQRKQEEVEHKKQEYEDPEGSAGKLPYPPDYKDIDVGRSGTNIHKDRNLEKSGSGEAE